MNITDIKIRNFEKIGKSHCISKKGMVATSHPLASNAGSSVLNDGGNAVDAALVMSIVLCMAEPQMTGIGGDCFALITKDGSTKNLKAINASGYAGKKYKSSKILTDRGINEITSNMPHSVTIPGAVSGWETLHQKYGKKSWKEIFQIALSYISEGVLVNERVSLDWLRNERKLSEDPDTKSIFLNNEKSFKFKELFKNERLVETLKLISEEGSRGFYNGFVAKDLCEKLNSLGGMQTIDDFSNYKAEWVEPIECNYKGYRIHECPPNGQGVTVFIILSMLKQFDLDKISKFEFYHLFCEVVKLSYSLRDNFLSDPKFYDSSYLNWIDKKIIDKYIKKIDLKKSSKFNRSDFPEHPDTVYLTARDKDGMTVSFINSLFDAFGSGITGYKTGVLLQCRGKSFSLKKGHPNELMELKRPLHTIIPGMISRNQSVIGSFGVMGGHYQAAGHAYLLSNLIDFGLSPQDALDIPRIFPNNGVIDIENGFDLKAIDFLKQKGHEINYPAFPIGGGQIILFDDVNNIMIGASDWRKDGVALGL